MRSQINDHDTSLLNFRYLFFLKTQALSPVFNSFLSFLIPVFADHDLGQVLF
jgi:hypothetical protein